MGGDALGGKHVAAGGQAVPSVGYCFDIITFFPKRFYGFVHRCPGDSDFFCQSFSGKAVSFVFFQCF